MMVEVLAPGVKHSDHADLGAQLLRIGGGHPQSFGRGLEYDRIDRRLVLECDLGHLSRHGEDQVEVGNRQQLGLTLGQPLGASQPLALRTMAVTAGVIGLAHQAAFDAVFGVTAQGRGPARLNRRHDAALDTPKMAVMVAAIVSPVAAEYIRHFQTRAHGARLNRAA